jgi:hypothetical protein
MVLALSTPGVVALLDQEDGCREGQRAGLDDSGAQHLRTMLLQFMLLNVCVPVWMHINWCCPQEQPDLVAELALLRQAVLP